MKLLSAKSVVKARLFKNSFVWSQIFVTRKCNLNCHYCGVVDNSRPNPTREQIKEWMRISKSVGCMGVALFGGEPFLRKDLEDIVRDATSMGLYTQLSTNLTLVNEERLYNLSFAGLGELRFSIDGLRDWKSSKKIRSSLENKINILLDNREELDFKLAATFVLTPKNYQEVYFILNYLKKYEIPLSIVPVEPKKIRNLNLPIYKTYKGFTYEQIRIIAENLVHKRRDRSLIDVSEEYLFQIPRYWVGEADWVCKAGQYTFTVDVDGNVGFCSSLDAYIWDIHLLLKEEWRKEFAKLSEGPKQWCTKKCLSGCQFNTSYYVNHWVDFIKTMW